MPAAQDSPSLLPAPTPAPAASADAKAVLRSLKKAVGADAVQLVSFAGNPRLLEDESPSEEISGNLLRAAGDLPAVAAGAPSISNTYRFGEQIVHLIARSAGDAVWLLVWLRMREGQSVDSVQEALALGVRSLAGGHPSSFFLGSGWEEFGAEVSPSERLRKFCGKVAEESGCKSVFLAKRGWMGWRIVGAAGSLPGRNSALSHAVLHGVKAEKGEGTEAVLEEIARGVSASEAKVFALDKQYSLVVAGEKVSDFSEDFLRNAPIFLRLLDVPHSFFGRWIFGLGGEGAKRKRFLLAGLGLLAVGVLAFPVSLPIRSEVLLEPSLRRFITAPFQGIIRTVGVRSGDVVQSGDLLVELDGREILDRLSDVEARLSMTVLQNASEMESANYSEAAVRALDARSLEHERDLLLYRKENLRLLSPLHGVVVAGDLERSEGAAVELGKRLLEIAPLETLVAEIAVDERDIAWVAVGQEVKIQLRAMPGKPFFSKVVRISPKAETRDEKNVFIVEAELPNPDDGLRPGMKGKAVISAGQAPLGWVLVRRPWQMFQRWMFL